MSALIRQSENTARRPAAQRVRVVAAPRARRAEEGTVTEMARSLLREAGTGLRAGERQVGRIEPAPAPVAEAA
jgi:riboflavin synthase